MPIARAVPLWGGISAGGFAIVLFHDAKKVCTEEWVRAVGRGKLTTAIKTLAPVKPRGPWHVICDNEKFLWAGASLDACAAERIKLWKMPAKSPDLNPVEKFWGWLRRQLRVKDLADLRAGRPPIGKLAFKARLRSICSSQRARTVATNFAMGLKRVCKAVVKNKGARVRN